MTATLPQSPVLLQAIEQLDYRVTVGDVAAQAGLEVHRAEQGLLALASQVGGHLQVAESGEVVYLFPRNFRQVLQRRDWLSRWQQWGAKLWQILLYLVRISFGLVLIGLILATIATIVLITIALSRGEGDGSIDFDAGDWGNWGGTDFFWIFYPDYGDRYPQRQNSEPPKLSFLAAVFSFLFGDGNPNADLETRRWQTIGAVIRNSRGAVIAEQLSPYLDVPETSLKLADEQYLLPVLTRFDGRPEATETGQLIYHFPALQITAAADSAELGKANPSELGRANRPTELPTHLQEAHWLFSQASQGQIFLIAGLGGILLTLAIWLNVWIVSGLAITGQLAGFAKTIALLALGYSTGFLAIPGIRALWLKRRNQRIAEGNRQRASRATQLAQATAQRQSNPVQQKLREAKQFAAETVLRSQDLIYSTETDLTTQEHQRSAQIDAEWQRRLDDA